MWKRISEHFFRIGKHDDNCNCGGGEIPDDELEPNQIHKDKNGIRVKGQVKLHGRCTNKIVIIPEDRYVYTATGHGISDQEDPIEFCGSSTSAEMSSTMRSLFGDILRSVISSALPKNGSKEDKVVDLEITDDDKTMNDLIVNEAYESTAVSPSTIQVSKSRRKRFQNNLSKFAVCFGMFHRASGQKVKKESIEIIVGTSVHEDIIDAKEECLSPIYIDELYRAEIHSENIYENGDKTRLSEVLIPEKKHQKKNITIIGIQQNKRKISIYAPQIFKASRIFPLIGDVSETTSDTNEKNDNVKENEVEESNHENQNPILLNQNENIENSTNDQKIMNDTFDFNILIKNDENCNLRDKKTNEEMKNVSNNNTFVLNNDHFIRGSEGLDNNKIVLLLHRENNSIYDFIPLKNHSQQQKNGNNVRLYRASSIDCYNRIYSPREDGDKNFIIFKNQILNSLKSKTESSNFSTDTNKKEKGIKRQNNIYTLNSLQKRKSNTFQVDKKVSIFKNSKISNKAERINDYTHNELLLINSVDNKDKININGEMKKKILENPKFGKDHKVRKLKIKMNYPHFWYTGVICMFDEKNSHYFTKEKTKKITFFPQINFIFDNFKTIRTKKPFSLFFIFVFCFAAEKCTQNNLSFQNKKRTSNIKFLPDIDYPSKISCSLEIESQRQIYFINFRKTWFSDYIYYLPINIKNIFNNFSSNLESPQFYEIIMKTHNVNLIVYNRATSANKVDYLWTEKRTRNQNKFYFQKVKSIGFWQQKSNFNNANNILGCPFSSLSESNVNIDQGVDSGQWEINFQNTKRLHLKCSRSTLFVCLCNPKLESSTFLYMNNKKYDCESLKNNKNGIKDDIKCQCQCHLKSSNSQNQKTKSNCQDEMKCIDNIEKSSKVPKIKKTHKPILNTCTAIVEDESFLKDEKITPLLQKCSSSIENEIPLVANSKSKKLRTLLSEKYFECSDFLSNEKAILNRTSEDEIKNLEKECKHVTLQDIPFKIVEENMDLKCYDGNVKITKQCFESQEPQIPIKIIHHEKNQRGCQIETYGQNELNDIYDIEISTKCTKGRETHKQILNTFTTIVEDELFIKHETLIPLLKKRSSPIENEIPHVANPKSNKLRTMHSEECFECSDFLSTEKVIFNRTSADELKNLENECKHANLQEIPCKVMEKNPNLKCIDGNKKITKQCFESQEPQIPVKMTHHEKNERDCKMVNLNEGCKPKKCTKHLHDYEKAKTGCQVSSCKCRFQYSCKIFQETFMPRQEAPCKKRCKRQCCVKKYLCAVLNKDAVESLRKKSSNFDIVVNKTLQKVVNETPKKHEDFVTIDSRIPLENRTISSYSNSVELNTGTNNCRKYMNQNNVQNMKLACQLQENLCSRDYPYFESPDVCFLKMTCPKICFKVCEPDNSFPCGSSNYISCSKPKQRLSRMAFSTKFRCNSDSIKVHQKETVSSNKSINLRPSSRTEKKYISKKSINDILDSPIEKAVSEKVLSNSKLSKYSSYVINELSKTIESYLSNKESTDKSDHSKSTSTKSSEPTDNVQSENDDKTDDNFLLKVFEGYLSKKTSSHKSNRLKGSSKKKPSHIGDSSKGYSKMIPSYTTDCLKGSPRKIPSHIGDSSKGYSKMIPSNTTDCSKGSSKKIPSQIIHCSKRFSKKIPSHVTDRSKCPSKVSPSHITDHSKHSSKKMSSHITERSKSSLKKTSGDKTDSSKSSSKRKSSHTTDPSKDSSKMSPSHLTDHSKSSSKRTSSRTTERSKNSSKISPSHITDRSKSSSKKVSSHTTNRSKGTLITVSKITDNVSSENEEKGSLHDVNDIELSEVFEIDVSKKASSHKSNRSKIISKMTPSHTSNRSKGTSITISENEENTTSPVTTLYYSVYAPSKDTLYQYDAFNQRSPSKGFIDRSKGSSKKSPSQRTKRSKGTSITVSKITDYVPSENDENNTSLLTTRYYSVVTPSKDTLYQYDALNQRSPSKKSTHVSKLFISQKTSAVPSMITETNVSKFKLENAATNASVNYKNKISKAVPSITVKNNESDLIPFETSYFSSLKPIQSPNSSNSQTFPNPVYSPNSENFLNSEKDSLNESFDKKKFYKNKIEEKDFNETFASKNNNSVTKPKTEYFLVISLSKATYPLNLNIMKEEEKLNGGLKKRKESNNNISFNLLKKLKIYKINYQKYNKYKKGGKNINIYSELRVKFCKRGGMLRRYDNGLCDSSKFIKSEYKR